MIPKIYRILDNTKPETNRRSPRGYAGKANSPALTSKERWKKCGQRAIVPTSKAVVTKSLMSPNVDLESFSDHL